MVAGTDEKMKIKLLPNTVVVTLRFIIDIIQRTKEKGIYFMDNNVLVIGNGYDVAHGLETKYEHFIKWIRNCNGDYSKIGILNDEEFPKRIKNNGFIKYFLDYAGHVPGWVDLERLLKDIIIKFEQFFLCYNKYIEGFNRINPSKYKSDTNTIVIKQMMYCISMFPFLKEVIISGDTCYEINDEYYSQSYGLNKKAIVSMLRVQLEDLIQLLKVYLEFHMNMKKDTLEKKSQLNDIKPSYVISFNYTDTYKLYEINKEKVYHVHGSIVNNNLVLGYDDENPTILDFIYFKKYFQRIQKLTGYIDENHLIKNNSGIIETSIVHFYGHSMDNTDGDIIRQLKTMAKKFIIYKYNQDDYEQKVINLISVFGKDEATEMIQKGFIQFVDCE